MDRDLLLAEDLLLVAYDERKGRDRGNWALDTGLAAALVLDGEAGGHIAEIDGLIHVSGPRPEHPVLAEALDRIAESPVPRDAAHWVHQLPKDIDPLQRHVATELAHAGVLREEHHRTLGLFETTRFPERDPEPEAALERRLRAALLDGARPDHRTARLIALLSGMRMLDRVVPRDRRDEAQARADEIGETGPASTAVDDMVKETIQLLAVTLATTAATSAATAPH